MDISKIEQAKKNKWSVCTYGLGYLGRRLYKEIPDMFGLELSYICDGDNSKVDDIQIPGVKGIYKSELLKLEKPVLVFILVDDPYDIEIKKDLKLNPNLIVYSLRDLALMKEVINIFYGKEIFEKYLELPDQREIMF